jgi:PAS domain-containing protein
MTTPSKPAYGYLIAIGAAVLVALIRYALAPILGDSAIFVMFTVPVILAGWYNGFRPAIVATVAGALLGIYLAPPTLGFSISSPRDVLGLAVFISCGIIISTLCESLHAAKERLRRSQVALHHEAALREEAERRSVATLEQMGDVFYVIDEQERFGYFNPAAHELFASRGVDPAAITGKNVWGDVPRLRGQRDPAADPPGAAGADSHRLRALLRAMAALVRHPDLPGSRPRHRGAPHRHHRHAHAPRGRGGERSAGA